ncbi:MAG: hypothetical protein H0W44_02635 [Gammaproteobacteria bacterium]|nr:hypothetical protein [Gammaproteobacteria bacterium]
MIVPIGKNNYLVFRNLSQAYEAEFSVITGKQPDVNGMFSLDTDCDESHDGFLLYESDIPIGFAVKGRDSGRHDMAEFYIIPTVRRQGLGEEFAQAIFRHYPGKWQVRQIEGADLARTFWRRVIKDYTHNEFVEEQIDDLYWGLVIRQQFLSDPAANDDTQLSML